MLALSAFDIALWDLKAKRANTALWRLLGGHDPRVPCYAGGIDLDLPVDALLRQTDANLARGFRAIKMKVGRPDLREDVERVAAMRAHLGPSFPLMVDANMAWTPTGRSAPPAPSPRTTPSGSRSRPSRRTWPATRASCARAGCRSPPARTCAASGSSRR